jgi:uncharacterized protein
MRFIPNIGLVLATGVLMVFSCGRGSSGEPSSGLTNQNRTENKTTGQDTSFRVTGQPPVPDQEGPVRREELFREACLDGTTGEVQDFLRRGVDPDAADADGRTGLMLAAYNGHTDIVNLLLDTDVRVNRADQLGRTALMYASTGDFPATVKTLLSHGADPNLVDSEEGFTALMFAAAEGNREVVQLLLDRGADADLKDQDGDTAGSFARQNGHMEVAVMLGG